MLESDEVKKKGSLSTKYFLRLLNDPRSNELQRQVEAIVFLNAFARFFDVPFSGGDNAFVSCLRFDAESFKPHALAFVKAINRIEVDGPSSEHFEDGIEDIETDG